MVKTVFFGSSPYSVIILQQLVKNPDISLVAVITKSDKPAGRQQQITANPVAQFARQNNLVLYQPQDFTPEFKSQIALLRPDLGLCVAYGPPFFDREMIGLFPFRIINIHPSPLPLYRGATPGPWQIINGETSSAVTFFQIDEKPDHGPIVSSIPFRIDPDATSEVFYQKAFSLAADNLAAILHRYIQNPDAVIPQNHDQRTYFPKLDKGAGQIDWHWDSVKIERFIRALIPWPVAWTFITDRQGVSHRMKIFSAHLENHNLVPDSVQIENKNKTVWSQVSPYYQIKKVS